MKIIFARKRFATANQLFLTFPSCGWLVLFFLIPAAMLFLISFRPTTPSGAVGTGWTLETWRSISNPSYPAIIWRTLWLSVATAAICIAVSVPAAFAVAKARPSIRHLITGLVVLPFWTSFLIRVFAWKVLLHPEGYIANAIAATGLFGPHVTLLNNPGAVLLVMVYTFLPFAMLPLFAAAGKFDFNLMEASLDLGAGPVRSFFKVFVPGIRAGIISAFLLVFIPALGSYVIPEMVGGASSEMIGTKITQRALSDRNLPHSSALSALLMFTVLLPPGVLWMVGRRRPGKPKRSAS